MHTLNQAEGNNYDIDVALIFDESALPQSALAARQRVRKAFPRRETFSRSPQRRGPMR